MAEDKNRNLDPDKFEVKESGPALSRQTSQAQVSDDQQDPKAKVIDKGLAKVKDVKAGAIGTSEYDQVIQKAQMSAGYVDAMALLVEKMAKLDYVTNPINAINLTGEGTAGLRGATARGQQTLMQPEAPQLQSTDINKNQAYIALASNIMGSLAGIIGGDTTGGAVAGAQAGAQALGVAAQDAASRQQANNALQNAYQKTVSSYNKDVADLNKTLMETTAENERKIIDKLVQVRIANQRTELESQEQKLRARVNELNNLKAQQGVLTQVQQDEMDMLKIEADNINRKKQIQAGNLNRKLSADIASNNLAISATNLSLKKLKANKNNFNWAKNLNALGTDTLAQIPTVDRLANYSNTNISAGMANNNRVNQTLGKLVLKYSPEKLKNNPDLRAEAEHAVRQMMNIAENNQGYKDAMGRQVLVIDATEDFYTRGRVAFGPELQELTEQVGPLDLPEAERVAIDKSIIEAPEGTYITVTADATDTNSAATIDMNSYFNLLAANSIKKALGLTSKREYNELLQDKKFTNQARMAGIKAKFKDRPGLELTEALQETNVR